MSNQLRLPQGFNIDPSPRRWLWLIPVTAFQIKCDVLSFACKFYTTHPSHAQGKPMTPSLQYPVSCLANYDLICYVWDKSLFTRCSLDNATLLSRTQWQNALLGPKDLDLTFQKTYSEDSGNCVTELTWPIFLWERDSKAKSVYLIHIMRKSRLCKEELQLLSSHCCSIEASCIFNTPVSCRQVWRPSGILILGTRMQLLVRERQTALQARTKLNPCSEKLFILCLLWYWNTKLYPWVLVAAWNQCVTRGGPVSHDNCQIEPGNHWI